MIGAIHLYDGIRPDEARVDRLAEFLGDRLSSFRIDVRSDFLGYWMERNGHGEEEKKSVSTRIAGAKVLRPDTVSAGRVPLGAEVDFELRFLEAGGDKPFGLLYDGHTLAGLYAGLISSTERRFDHCHVVLINQLVGTWDENDLRYHARTSVYSFPSIISASGLVEAPAKPREFYLAQGMGVRRGELDEGFAGRVLNHGDPGLENILPGYLLQAVFYHLAGDPFCESRDCRLFNAHWQADMMYAQARPGADLCERHKAMMGTWLGCLS